MLCGICYLFYILCCACNALYYGIYIYIYIYTVLCNVWNREGLYCVALLYFIDNIYIHILYIILINMIILTNSVITRLFQ